MYIQANGLQPWLVNDPQSYIDREGPSCPKTSPDNDPKCRARKIWVDIYLDFQKRRKVRASSILLSQHRCSLLLIVHVIGDL